MEKIPNKKINWIFFQSFDWLLSLGSSSQIKILYLFSGALLPLDSGSPAPSRTTIVTAVKFFFRKVVKAPIGIGIFWLMMLGRGSLDVSEFEKKPAIKSDTYAQHVVNLRLPSHPNYQSAKKVGKEFCNNCIFSQKFNEWNFPIGMCRNTWQMSFVNACLFS